MLGSTLGSSGGWLPQQNPMQGSALQVQGAGSTSWSSGNILEHLQADGPPVVGPILSSP